MLMKIKKIRAIRLGRAEATTSDRPITSAIMFLLAVVQIAIRAN